MEAIEELLILEDPVEDVFSVKDILDEIKDMINQALALAKRYLAGATMLTLMVSSTGDIMRNIIIDDSVPCIEITVPVEAVPGTIKIASVSEARVRLNDKIRSLTDLEDGWDGEAALKPSKLALQNMKQLVSHLDDNVLISSTVFPSNDAGIYLQANLRKGRMTVFVDDSRMAFVIKGAPGKVSASVKIDPHSLNYLNQGLTLYV